ncbi:hypothetical protein ATEG_08960 [Aspergillus terreus NIH2624]|uniref:RAS small monomeric GTPase n=1 Tax=Aspergillus terreus (strain NIH 2624 / FGSC A1156) TaxID=341663 RepID=Q0CBH4_ASPTN|nr:uncharacterized protein ATEG_08960 [Aspergillus terreus NIH2624]EAU31092.1 hypothetical protein ATEG_08960 [Aspergillus terreus NIH2624]
MADDAPNKISVTICGDGGCEDSYSVTRTIDGIPYFLSITDTAGQEEYRGLWTAATLKSDAFLLVYDITNAASLGALDYFMDLIDIEAEQRLEDNDRLRKELGDSAHGLDVGMPPPVKIIAGNKCDLKDARAIAARDGLEYARQHGCGFMETSAREMVNIEETFALLVRRVVEARRLHYQSGRATAHGPAGESSAAKTPGEARSRPAEVKATETRRSPGGWRRMWRVYNIVYHISHIAYCIAHRIIPSHPLRAKPE